MWYKFIIVLLILTGATYSQNVSPEEELNFNTVEPEPTFTLVPSDVHPMMLPRIPEAIQDTNAFLEEELSRLSLERWLYVDVTEFKFTPPINNSTLNKTLNNTTIQLFPVMIA